MDSVVEYRFADDQNSTDQKYCGLDTDSSNKKCEILHYSKLVSSTVSIVGSVFTLIIVVLYKKYKKFTQRMIVYLTVAALLLGISFTVDEVDKPGLDTWQCVIQGTLMNFSVISILSWCACIQIDLYLRVIFKTDWQKKEPIITILCWGIPLVLASLPFIDSAYGPAGLWCWIKNENNRFGWRFGIFYFWDMLFIVAFFVSTGHIIYKMFSEGRERRLVDVVQMEALYEDIQTLRKYPIVYLIVNIGPLVGRLQNAVIGQYTFPVLLLQTLTNPFIGAGIAIAFVLDMTKLLNKRRFWEAVDNWRQPTTAIREYGDNRYYGSCENSTNTIARNTRE